jgi:hypothetical protein
MAYYTNRPQYSNPNYIGQQTTNLSQGVWQPSGFDNIVNFVGSFTEPIRKTTSNLTDALVSGARSVGGDQNAFRDFNQRSMQLYGAKDADDLNKKRWGNALETAAWLVPYSKLAKFGGKILGGAVGGAMGGAAFGAGDALNNGGNAGDVLKGTTIGSLTGGAFGGVLGGASRAASAIKQQGANRIVQNQSANVATLNPAMRSALGSGALNANRRQLYGNGLRQVGSNAFGVAKSHPLATVGVVGGGLYGANQVRGLFNSQPDTLEGAMASYGRNQPTYGQGYDTNSATNGGGGTEAFNALMSDPDQFTDAEIEQIWSTLTPDQQMQLSYYYGGY